MFKKIKSKLAGVKTFFLYFIPDMKRYAPLTLEAVREIKRQRAVRATYFLPTNNATVTTRQNGRCRFISKLASINNMG